MTFARTLYLVAAAAVFVACSKPANNEEPLTDGGADASSMDAGDGGLIRDADPDLGSDLSDLSDSGPLDQGVDMAPPERKLLSPSLRDTLNDLSPVGGIAPPVDLTNEYADSDAAVRFGQYIFYEASISGNGSVSCATCHRPDYAFAEPTALPELGIQGPANAPGRHTPTLLNIAYNKWYFWDGRVDTLWGQAIGPYESAIEMGGSRLQLAHYVYDALEVREAYEAIFGALPDEATIDPFPARGRPISLPNGAAEVAQNDAWLSMTEQGRQDVDQILVNVAKAIAAFEMRLNSFDAPFDQFAEQVRTNPDDPESWDAISAEAQEGFRLFADVTGCMECHKGALMANDEFHNLGVEAVEWADPTDPGRKGALAQAQQSPFSSAGPYSADPTGQRARFLMNVPEQPDALGSFRTPTLRNVAMRPPFMHAGQHADLTEAMEFYNEPPDDQPVVGVRDNEIDPLELSEAQVSYMVEFLEALDGSSVDSVYLSQPASPLP